jgi:hypothetical protein
MGIVVRPDLGFGCLLSRFAAGKTLPQFAELLRQFGILQIAEAFARDHHDVPSNQIVLIETERFADLAFQAVALNSELDALLADHQPQAWMIELVVARKQQDIPARRFTTGRVEDCLELPGRKQPLVPAEASTHHKTG